MIAHRSPISGVDAFGERLVATAGYDNQVILWDRATKSSLSRVFHDHLANQCRFSRDGRLLVTASSDYTARIWSVPSMRMVAVLCAHDDDVEGSIICIAGGGRRDVHAHDAGIKRLVRGPGRLLVSASYDRTAKVWEIAAGGGLVLRQTIDVPDPVWLRSLAFAGPTQLIFATFGRTYASYDLDRGRWDLEGVHTTPGINSVRAIGDDVYTVGDAGVVSCNDAPVADLGTLCNFLSQLGSTVVTGGQTGQLFDAVSGDVLYRHSSPLNCATGFVDGGTERLMIGAYTGEGLVFEADEAGRPRHLATVKLHDNAIKGSHDRIANGVAVLSDGRFASVSRDRKLRLWSLDGHEAIGTPHDHSIKCVAASSHGRLVATGSYDGKVALYDWGSSRWEDVRRPTASGISCLAAAVGAPRFLASSYDGNVYELEPR